MAKKAEVWFGLKGLRPLLVPISKLKEDPENARKHSERNVSVIAHSLSKLGQHRAAVVTKDGTCVVGSGMLQAARALDWTHVAAVRCEDDAATRKLRAVTDNRSGSESIGSEWSFPILADVLTELDTGEIDLAEFGWSPEELEQIMTSAPPPEEPEPTPSAGKTVKCPACGEEFVPTKGE